MNKIIKIVKSKKSWIDTMCFYWPIKDNNKILDSVHNSITKKEIDGEAYYIY